MPSTSGLRAFEFKGLFGSINDKVVLDDERPTVLTGPNGSGKSTLLRLVSAASNGDLPTLAAAPISRFSMKFDHISDFEVSRASRNAPTTLRWGKRTGQLDMSPRFQELPSWASELLARSEYDVELALEHLAETASEFGVEFSEYSEVRASLSQEARRPLLRAPEWLQEFALEFPVLFVTDQRLVTEPRPSPRARSPHINKRTSLAVESVSSDIRNSLNRADSDYARSSQLRDRDLPERIVDAMQGKVLATESELASLVSLTNSRREALRTVGLLDENVFFQPNLSDGGIQDENVRRVMRVVLETTLAKFESLQQLELRLTTFKQFLDDRFSPKSVDLTRNEGIRFTLDGGETIRARQLSSGEQQITVLAHEILFKTQPGTLVIIDEPEISLHVLWQDTLVEDLRRMGSASRVQFLMATHSPIILAGNRELERPLSGARTR